MTTPEVESKPLKFKVASHIVEDLGLNLYTSLPRVLVEFVANAYDADSPIAAITFDKKAIEAGRKLMKADFEREKALAEAKEAAAEAKGEPSEEGSAKVPSLGSRTLPEEYRIVIRDAGIGMTREELQDKFLMAGRRRRHGEQRMTKKNRVIMGRKGLGKLAGFGIAKKVEVITRTEGSPKAIRIVLDFDELVAERILDEVKIPDTLLDTTSDLPGVGTVIILSRLLYDPMKSQESTIEHEIADHFSLIDPADFKISVNGNQINPTPRALVYGWPKPDVDVLQFVDHTLEPKKDDPEDDVPAVSFRYRIRFTDKSLGASERGVRVYANKRLASIPSLLDTRTAIHGFQMSAYLDGVVHADFIDEQEADYISTDRHSLRWEAPLLRRLREFLSSEIVAGCKAYQAKRDVARDKEVKEDVFTKELIENSNLSKSERKVLRDIARGLGKHCNDGVADPFYRSTLPELAHGLSHGNILTALTKLADQDHPNFDRLVLQVTRLTKDELEMFARRARARLTGIRALKKVVEHVDFRTKPQNEKEIQKLFEKNAWLIDPTYTQFLAADQRTNSVFKRLSEYLKIDTFAPTTGPSVNKRPDLVFTLSNEGLARLIIVELKSANLPLSHEHLTQLEFYMEQAERWLEGQKMKMKVEGHLIGSLPDPNSTAEGAILLTRAMRDRGPSTPWIVRDYIGVLNSTEAAHNELLDMKTKELEDAAADDGEDEEA